MVGLLIFLVILFLLIIPFGLDILYEKSSFSLKLKLSIFRLVIFPKKEKKKAVIQHNDAEEKKSSIKKKSRLKRDDWVKLIRIGLQTLQRFRIHLSIDLFRLYVITAGRDPYDTVLKYGRINATLCTIQPIAHTVFRVREEDIQITADFDSERTQMKFRLIMTIQLWEVLWIALCTGISVLRWYILRRKSGKGLKLNIEKG